MKSDGPQSPSKCGHEEPSRETRPLRHLLLSAIALLASAGALRGEVLAFEVLALDGMQGLSTAYRQVVRSEALGTAYTLLVRQPESLDSLESREEGSPLLPVVYLLDGGLTFPALGAYYRFLRLGDEVPELILVGISYGNDDWGAGNQRARDYTAPSAEQEQWGGVGAFLDFLQDDLMPRIEAQFPADPARRILFGHSLGGQAVLYAAQHRPGLFWGHIASNPALHRNLSLFLPQGGSGENARSAVSAGSRLFVANALEQDALFAEPAREWSERWSGVVRDGSLETRFLVGHTHFSSPPEAFRLGLWWLFGQPPGEPPSSLEVQSH